MRATQHILIVGLRVYRCLLSPLLRLLFGTSGACRYSPTCSCYAMEAIERHGACAGSRLTAGRLLRCHPWGGAGYDPVPEHPNLDPASPPDLLGRLRSGLGLRVKEAGGTKN